MNFKKLLAITLVLAMVLSFMPTFAFADDEIVTEEPASEAAAEEPVVEEDPVVEEEPEAPQEEPETWDAPEDVIPEEPVEEPEVGVEGTSVLVKFYPGLATGEAAAYTATATGTTTVVVSPADDTAAKEAVKEKNPGVELKGWLDENGNRIVVTTAFDRPSSGVKNVTAEWGDPISYDVTYTAVPSTLTDIVLPKAESVKYNDNPVVKTAAGADPDLDAENYEFDGFYVNSQKVAGTLAEMRAYKVTGTTAVTLKWLPVTISQTVEFVYKDAKTDSIRTGGEWTIKSGTTDTTVATVTKSGTIPAGYNTGIAPDVMTHKDYDTSKTEPANHYVFDKWVPGGNYKLNDKVNTDETFTATWKLETNKVHFYVDDPVVAAKDETVEYGGHAVGFTPEQTQAHKDAHEEFVGWSKSAGGAVVKLLDEPIKAETNFYAIWAKNTNKVSFVLNGGAGAFATQFADQNIPYGGELKDPGVPTKFGYHFTGWTLDAAGEGAAVTFPLQDIKEPKTLYAQYDGNEYKLAIDTADLVGVPLKYDGKDLVNPVATITKYGGAQGTSFEVKALTADGFAFNGYTYEYYKDTVTKEKGTKTVAAGTSLQLDDTMVITSGTLTLKPVITSKFYVVKFENKNGTTSLGDVVEQTFEYYPTQTTARKVTTPTLKDGTQLPVGAVYKDLFLQSWINQETGNAWDFGDNVNANMTLVAHYKPFWTVTFAIRDDAKWATGETGKRVVIEGRSIADMATVAEKNKAVADYLTAKGSINFKLPEATREGYNQLTWTRAGSTTVFKASDPVSEDTKVTDNWSQVFWTVTYDANGGDLTDVTSEKVENGKTVAKRSDPIKSSEAFDGWVYTPTSTGKETPFVFGTTKIVEDTTVKATWTIAQASIGTKNYATIAAAIEDAAVGATIKLVPTDLSLTDTVNVTKDVTFDFSGHTVNGGVFATASGATLTVKGGTFKNTAFTGAVDLKDGTFVGTKFTGATLTTFGGKYDAAAARPINAEQLQNENKVLAVAKATPDGYYRCVEKQTLAFVLQEGTQSVANIVVGKGAAPVDAIEEAYAAKLITKEQYGKIMDPKAEGKTFVYWTVGSGTEAKQLKLGDAYEGGDAVALAKWKNSWTASFVVEGKTVFTSLPYEEAASTSVTYFDPTNYIDTTLNDGKADWEKVVFECWVDANGKDVKNWNATTPLTVTTNTNLTFTAKMKAKVLFDPLDVDHYRRAVWYNHGDRLSATPPVLTPADWVSSDGRAYNSNDIVNGDLSYYVKKDVTEWNLYAYSPDNHFDVATGVYSGSNTDPIVVNISGEGAAAVVPFEFTVEAPNTVTESSEFWIQVDGSAWTLIQPKGTLGAVATWEGRSPNNNLTVKVTETLTVDQIKTAAKSGSPFNFAFNIGHKTSPAATTPTLDKAFNITFNPSNVKLTNYTANPDNESKVLLIRDGVFQYTLTYALAGGKFSDDTKATSTVEYGTKVVLPANPTKSDTTNKYLFNEWTSNVTSKGPYWGGYIDPIDHKIHPEGYTVDGKQYGGTFVNGKFVKNSFVMEENITLTASYNTVSVVVNITDNGSTTTDLSFMLSSTLSDVAAKLPTPKPTENQIFSEWQYQKGTPATTETNWATFTADANKTIEKLLTGTGLTELNIRAKYSDVTKVTYKNGADTVISVKQAYTGSPIAASKFYTDDVKTAETSIDLFEYWTAVEPTNGGYAKAPAKYNFDTEIVPAAGKTLYAYVPYTEYTVKIHPAGGGVNEIKVEHGKTIPSKDLPVVEGQVGWSTVDPATAQPVDFPADTPIKADTEIWAYYQIFTVKYDANGGKDAPKDQTKVFGIDLELTKDEPTLIGREFLGWAKTATATEPEFKGGDKYKENKDVTLYAVWSEGEPVTEFVKRAYSLILGREADQEGLDYWVKGLQDKTFKGGDIVSQFMNSDEYVLANHPNAEAVTAVYKTMLDREPDAEGQAYWVGLLDKGCSYNMIINGFCDSAEFKGICDQYGIEPGTVATERRDVNPELTAFVSRNYKCALNRTGDSFGLNYWAGQLLDKAQTPYEVAHGFVFSEECVARGLNNTQFVTMLYKLYMDREPEADGLAYWVGQLDNKTMTREEVEKGFADSPEFAEIIKSYGL